MRRCYKCQKPYLETHAPGVQEVCEGCGSYVHCCHNCRFYDAYASNHCREPQADPVTDPHDMNHCEYFIFRDAGTRDRPDPEDPGLARARRRPDWRNIRKEEPRSTGRARNRDPAERGQDEKTRQARANLDKLFGGGG